MSCEFVIFYEDKLQKNSQRFIMQCHINRSGF